MNRDLILAMLRRRRDPYEMPEETVSGRRLNVDPFGLPPVLRGASRPQMEPMVPSGPMQTPGLPSMMDALPQNPAQMPGQRPSFIDRLKNGIELPDKPTHYKHRGSQNFLRGLVHGFKGGDGPQAGPAGRGGVPGGRAVNQEYEDARTDSQRALAEQRRARASEIAEPDPVEVDPYFDVKADAWKALAEQRRAAARRSDRAPAGRSGGGRSGGGGGSKMTFAGERAALNAKYQSEKTRLMGAIQKHYGPLQGPVKTKQEKAARAVAQAAWARKQAEVASGYQRRLAEINERWGADIEGDDGAQAPAPARGGDPFTDWE